MFPLLTICPDPTTPSLFTSVEALALELELRERWTSAPDTLLKDLAILIGEDMVDWFCKANDNCRLGMLMDTGP